MPGSFAKEAQDDKFPVILNEVKNLNSSYWSVIVVEWSKFSEKESQDDKFPVILNEVKNLNASYWSVIVVEWSRSFAKEAQDDRKNAQDNGVDHVINYAEP